jgi:hypothetical protein
MVLGWFGDDGGMVWGWVGGGLAKNMAIVGNHRFSIRSFLERKKNRLPNKSQYLLPEFEKIRPWSQGGPAGLDDFWSTPGNVTGSWLLATGQRSAPL